MMSTPVSMMVASVSVSVTSVPVFSVRRICKFWSVKISKHILEREHVDS